MSLRGDITDIVVVFGVLPVSYEAHKYWGEGDHGLLKGVLPNTETLKHQTRLSAFLMIEDVEIKTHVKLWYGAGIFPIEGCL